MSDTKVVFENSIDEIDMIFVDLIKTIDLSIKDIRNVFKNLDESVDNKVLNIDYSKEIKKRYSSGLPLTRPLLKYYWANFLSFDLEMVEWCQRMTPMSGSVIERYVIKSWSQLNFDESKNFSYLEKYVSEPSFLPRWQVLDQLHSAFEFQDQVVFKYLHDEYSVPATIQRTLLFRYMVAICCYRQLDEISFIKLMDVIKDSSISSLNIDIMCEEKHFDSASNLMIASLLKYFRNGAKVNDQIYLWLNSLKSILGDPRSLGHNWGKIEEIEKEGYANWLSTLNEEDIQFFFENLEKVIHPERREFWLKFVRSARRIVVVLDEVQRTKLIKKFQKNEKMLEVINRSFQFNSGSSSAQQLIVFFFNGYVVVEGSNTGFGCQVYRETTFKARFGSSFYQQERTSKSHLIKHSTPTVFAGEASGREKMLRHAPKSPGWERDFLNYFSTIDIFPDSVGSRRRY